MQFPEPQIAIKMPTDRMTIKHNSWWLSVQFGFVQRKRHPARWLVQEPFFFFFFSCQDLWALWACVRRQIFYPLDKSAAKKSQKHLEHRAALRCTRPWAVTEFVWIPLIHARLAKPSGQETWKRGGVERGGGRKDGIHQGEKEKREEKTICVRKTVSSGGELSNETTENQGITACVKQVVRLHRSTNRLRCLRRRRECVGSFAQKVQWCNAGRPPATIRGVKIRIFVLKRYSGKSESRTPSLIKSKKKKIAIHRFIILLKLQKNVDWTDLRPYMSIWKLWKQLW